jgi:hypothetical protein
MTRTSAQQDDQTAGAESVSADPDPGRAAMPESIMPRLKATSS